MPQYSREAELYLRHALARFESELAAFDIAVANHGLKLWSHTAGGPDVDLTDEQRERQVAIIAQLRRALDSIQRG